MNEWIEVLSTDDENAPLPDDIIFKDNVEYIIEVFLGGAIGSEEIKTVKAVYFEGPGVFISGEPEIYDRYNIWRYKESEV